MNRPLVALFSALEALLVVGIGIGLPLVPLTIIWAFQYGLQVDWTVFWRASVDVWLLGHGVDLRFVLDPLVATATGLPAAGEPFAVSLAPLAFALVTVLLGVRAGRRVGETPHRTLGLLTAVGAFAVLSGGAALTAQHPDARPFLAVAVLLPAVVFGVGVAIGSVTGRQAGVRNPLTEPLSAVADWIDHRSPTLRRAVAAAVAGGVAAVAMVLAVSAVAVAVLLAANYGQIVALYQAVQSGPLGGIALTMGQLALLPNLIVWAAAWFVGPGFAIGTGSTVGPLGTVLGPLPAIPILGALPTGDFLFGFVGLLVPVLAGFFSGVVIRARFVAMGNTRPLWLAGAGVGMGLVAGLTLGMLAWASGGAAGPGRLADVGASPVSVGLWAALEIGLPATLALMIGSLRGREWTVPMPDLSRYLPGTRMPRAERDADDAGRGAGEARGEYDSGDGYGDPRADDRDDRRGRDPEPAAEPRAAASTPDATTEPIPIVTRTPE
ncbi:cell division protein PerM [Marisediminicola senii]|uniref:cell division protein PerM n=1 Tax=Marisediminicola senii TaxID=2711233 RepID=UPI0019119474|nr:DUF6350 family protein [Marisediminicola senii]